MNERRCYFCGAVYSFKRASLRETFLRILRPYAHSDSRELSHIEAVHPEYSLWVWKWRRSFLTSNTVAVPLLILGDYFGFETGNDLVLLIGTISYLIIMQVVVSLVPLKMQQVKRQWGHDHGMANWEEF